MLQEIFGYKTQLHVIVQPFTPLYQYANSHHRSLYISYGKDKENLLNNLELLQLTIISNILVSFMFNKVGRNQMLVTQSSNASSKAGFAGCYFSTWLSSLLLQSILMVLICCSSKLRYMFSSCIFSFNWLMAVNKRHCSE